MGLYWLTCSSFLFPRVVRLQDSSSFAMAHLLTELSSVLNSSLSLSNLNYKTNPQHFKGIFFHQPDCSPAKKASGQPSYLLNLDEDQQDLEFASFCWVTYKCSNNTAYPKFITNYGQTRYFIFERIAYQFTKKNSKACHPIPPLCHLTMRH